MAAVHQAKKEYVELSNEQLLQNQVSLQNQASDVLSELELLPLLGKFGRTHITGSMQMGLMVWPDIDVELIVSGRPNLDDMLAIAKEIVVKPGIRQVGLSYHIGNTRGFPDGLYAGLKYTANSGKSWQIDIWMIPEKDAVTRQELMDLYKSKLDEDSRRVILWLKNILASNPKYHR